MPVLSFAKAGASGTALKGAAEYLRKHSSEFVVDGPRRLSTLISTDFCD
jgi:hypothetical protein